MKKPNKSVDITNFSFKENAQSFFLETYKIKIFNLVTKRSLGFFMKPKDIITVRPQISGIHEPHITQLIEYLAQAGNNDFLIDIGANIGLSSCQNGNSFKQVHMFEPNPMCRKILEVNTVIALHTTYHVYPFGLGDKSTTCRLTVPKQNWGGAFIDDQTNSYDPNVLAKKDGFSELNSENYFKVDIEVKNSQDVFEDLFKKLSESELKRGVIKLDVEGYEPAVLDGLARAIPKNISVFVIFESWSQTLDTKKILEAFNGRASIYKIEQDKSWFKKSKIKKLVSLLLNQSFTTKVTKNAADNWVGDLVIQIN